jgi:hypothetical protein
MPSLSSRCPCPPNRYFKRQGAGSLLSLHLSGQNPASSQAWTHPNPGPWHDPSLCLRGTYGVQEEPTPGDPSSPACPGTEVLDHDKMTVHFCQRHHRMRRVLGTLTWGESIHGPTPRASSMEAGSTHGWRATPSQSFKKTRRASCAVAGGSPSHLIVTSENPSFAIRDPHKH